MIALANLGVERRWARWFTWGLIGLLAGLAALLALVTALMSVLPLSGVRGFSLQLSLGALVVAATGAAVLLPAGRRLLARVLPLEPESPVHALAVFLVVMVAAFQLVVLVQGSGMTDAATGGAVGPKELLLGEIPFALVALVGVGIWIRRRPALALQRLGFPKPDSRQGLMGLLAAVVLTGVANLFEVAGRHFLPGQAHALDQVNNALYAHVTNLPTMALFALTAGVCEELLFRGALQPRFGLLPTTVLFALLHSQYGLTYATAEVFTVGLGLGWLRMRWGLLACIAAHCVYDLGAFALPSLTPLLPTLAAAAAAAALAAFIWRRGPLPPVTYRLAPTPD